MFWKAKQNGVENEKKKSIEKWKYKKTPTRAKQREEEEEKQNKTKQRKKEKHSRVRVVELREKVVFTNWFQCDLHSRLFSIDNLRLRYAKKAWK